MELSLGSLMSCYKDQRNASILTSFFGLSLVRALYERVAEVEQELSFNKDDILYVEDTLPNGNFGYWMAWQLDENAQKLGKGQIPSKYM